MTTPDARATRAYCLFPYRSRWLAVGVDAVETVLEAPRLVRLPLCPRPPTSMCSHRGGVLPVVEPAVEGEEPGEEPGGRRPAVLVLRTARGPIGLRIDRAGIAVVEDGPTAGVAGAATLPDGLVAAGTIDREGRSHAILDPDRTWAALRALIDRGYAESRGSLDIQGDGSS